MKRLGEISIINGLQDILTIKNRRYLTKQGGYVVLGQVFLASVTLFINIFRNIVLILCNKGWQQTA